MLPRHRGHHRLQLLSFLLREGIPHPLPGRGIQTAVVADLVEVDVRDQLGHLLPVGRLGHRVAPALELRVAGEQQLLRADFEQQDQAGVVHLVVELPDDFEQPLTGNAEQTIAEPARFFRNRLAAFHLPAVLACGGQPWKGT